VSATCGCRRRGSTMSSARSGAALDRAPPGLLTGTDRAIFTAWVCACVEYERAVQEVRALGQVVKTKDGNAIQNPYLSIMNRQAMLMSRFGAEMGFSPAARATLGARIQWHAPQRP
jgi:P27 family predicted phage terminase small subunit